MPQRINDHFQTRICAVQKKLHGYQVDGIIFSSMCNIRYLTGFTGSDGVFIIGPDNIRLLVDGRYTFQATAEVFQIPVIQYSNKIDGIKQAAKELKLERIGFEAAIISVEMFEALKQKCKESNFVPLVEELRMLRAFKDRYEISLMKKAAAIASEALTALANDLRPGWTESETALELELKARRAGAEQVAFETIVASGENGARPHARPSNRKITYGDFVVIDFGVKYHGYCSDETCTLAIGELTGAQKNAYRAVLQAHDDAIAIIKAGITAADVDRHVRKVFGKKYNRNFVHGTGHGVGLEVHEAPRLAPKSTDVLNTGMVVTIEPGLYYPGEWGIRIEDTVLVKKNGCEIFTKMNKRMIVIE